MKIYDDDYDDDDECMSVRRWWKETELAEKLPFARDRVLENYIWNVGLLFKPQYGYARIMTTKLFILITVIDDVFDVYATLEETQLFKNATQRWAQQHTRAYISDSVPLKVTCVPFWDVPLKLTCFYRSLLYSLNSQNRTT